MTIQSLFVIDRPQDTTYYSRYRLLRRTALRVDIFRGNTYTRIALCLTHKALRHGSHSFYLQITPCLPFVRKRSPDGATPNWGSRRAIASYYWIIDPEGAKGWVGLVGWPIADSLPTKMVIHQLQIERKTGKFAGQRPTFFRCTCWRYNHYKGQEIFVGFVDFDNPLCSFFSVTWPTRIWRPWGIDIHCFMCQVFSLTLLVLSLTVLHMRC